MQTTSSQTSVRDGAIATQQAAPDSSAALAIRFLRQFHESPDSAQVDVQVVAAVFDCSIPTIWRNCKNGKIPAPRRLTARTTRWNVGELRSVLGLKRGTL
jgi:predicted DNA-binding transcriptional regulator AlpA